MTRMTTKRPDTGTPQRSPHRVLVEEDLTRAVIGAYYEVYNTLAYGFLESVYSRALYLELGRRGLKVAREVSVDVYYKGDQVGFFRADMLVESRVVLEIKATSAVTPADRQQLLNCLRCSKLEVGLLLHFGPRPSFQRVVAENGRSTDPVISGLSASS
jgi:GxxExxY protein